MTKEKVLRIKYTGKIITNFAKYHLKVSYGDLLSYMYMEPQWRGTYSLWHLYWVIQTRGGTEGLGASALKAGSVGVNK